MLSDEDRLSDEDLHEVWEDQPAVQPAGMLVCKCGQELFFTLDDLTVIDCIACVPCGRHYQIVLDASLVSSKTE